MNKYEINVSYGEEDLNKLIAFRDTEPVKVVTGIRRCGKSSLLKLMAKHLVDTGVGKEQIIEMNFFSDRRHHLSTHRWYKTDSGRSWCWYKTGAGSNCYW